MESNLKKCTACKKNYELEHYTKGNKILKCCLSCRNIGKKSQIKNKCIHGRIKYSCIECGGGGICLHGRRKNRCKQCGGVGICLHGRRKNRCKQCGGVDICLHNKIKSCCKLCSNPLHITIKRMIQDSKQSDKKYNRYDETEFIDYDYLFNLIDISNDICVYCDCPLQYIYYQHDLASIERINNQLGHIKSNVLISCYKCNVSHVGSR